MQLNRQTWTKKDGSEFKLYLRQFACGTQASVREQKIVNTQMEFYATRSADITKICKQIAAGNFQAFIDLWITDNYPLVLVLGCLICKIKDFAILKNYLLKYAELVDNWAHIDLLKFDVNATNKQLFFTFAKELCKHPKPFARRMGIRILFKFINDQTYLDQIFKILNSFEHETEYYVNMCNAWIIAECFAQQREKTMTFLSHHHLNTFTINKAISKCRDSFRVSDADKAMLLGFKKVTFVQLKYKNNAI